MKKLGLVPASAYKSKAFYVSSRSAKRESISRQPSFMPSSTPQNYTVGNKPYGFSHSTPWHLLALHLLYKINTTTSMIGTYIRDHCKECWAVPHSPRFCDHLFASLLVCLPCSLWPSQLTRSTHIASRGREVSFTWARCELRSISLDNIYCHVFTCVCLCLSCPADGFLVATSSHSVKVLLPSFSRHCHRHHRAFSTREMVCIIMSYDLSIPVSCVLTCICSQQTWVYERNTFTHRCSIKNLKLVVNNMLVLCCAVLCGAVLCYSVLCCAMPCCTVLSGPGVRACQL